MQDWHRLSTAETLAQLETHVQQGLSTEEAMNRRQTWGWNELAEKPRETLLRKFVNQFKDFLVLVLLVASVLSVFIGDITDSLVIVAIVLLNASLGVFQEAKAEKALEALKKMAAPVAKVLRPQGVCQLPARELVPGDIVILEAGDYIPADVRLMESVNFKVEEASLTGESTAVEKNIDTITGEATIGDRLNMGFMSTVVTYGRAKGVVVATGMRTELGKIADLLQTAKEDATPLQKKLQEFGKMLGVLCLLVCAVILAVGIYGGYRDGNLSLPEVQLMVMTSISLAVAAIPEGLPTVVTIVLALGVQRMAGKQAIIKKLHAVETLGSTTVICSDKTGTLTQNQMTVVRMMAGERQYEVTGHGYRPAGAITSAGEAVAPGDDSTLERLLLGAALCNDAELREGSDAESWTVVGDPTEGALLAVAAKGGYLQAREEYPRVAEIPFDSGRKMMTTFHARQQALLAFTKGAPDVVLQRCDRLAAPRQPVLMDDISRAAIGRTNQAMAGQALRVLALAYKEWAAVPDLLDSAAVEAELIFIGLVGMIDPARPEAKAAVDTCIAAGIRPVMITGDHPGTALAIARELGIAADEQQVLTGLELNGMSPADLAVAVRHTTVFARVSPEHKMDIVEALRANDEIVAMTGDGVNDAPALKKAHIGIAMGITGTDVTKEAADMVIGDDNFASIVTAVEEGRIIFANIKKFVYFLLSCNAAEVLVVFCAMLLGWPIPLLPIQLLWVNLVTDAFPALALGMEKKEPAVMERSPRSPKEPLLGRNLQAMIALQSGMMMVAVLAAFQYGWQGYDGDVAAARTFAFMTLIFSQVICAYSARAEYYPVHTIGFFSNNYLNLGAMVSIALLLAAVWGPLHGVFRTVVPTAVDVAMVVLLAPLPFVAVEFYKFACGRYYRR